MKHTKLLLIAVALIAVAYTQDECVLNPMRNAKNSFMPDDTTVANLLDAPAAYPAAATFCKAMKDVNVCCTEAGFKAVYDKWTATKAAMKAARDAKLATYNTQKKWLVEHLNDLVGMAADAMSLAEETMRLATKFFKKGRVAWGEDFSKFPIADLDQDTITKFSEMMDSDPNMPQKERRFLQDTPTALPFKWPAAIPEGTEGMGEWERTLVNSITQGTGPTEELDFVAVRAKYRKSFKATLKAKFTALQAAKIVAFKAQRDCFAFLMKVSASQACLTCSSTYATAITKIDENSSKMKFKKSVAKNLRDKCFPAIVGLQQLGLDYLFMARMQFTIETEYKVQKEVFNMGRKVFKRFVDSDMMGSAINRLLNDVMDKKTEIEDKMKGLDEDANKFIREKEVWKMAFKYDKTTCTADSCLLLRKWISRNGFSEDATSMTQFNPPDMTNITIADLPEGDGSAMSEEDEESRQIEDTMKNFFNQDTGVGARLLNSWGSSYVLPRDLAEGDDLTLDFEDDTATWDAGSEVQVDAAETEVAQIDQTVDATEATAADAVGETDTGEVGGGLEGDDDDSSSGMPGWVWILIAVLVLLVIGGVIFMVMRNKGDEDLDAHNEDINMANTGFDHHNSGGHH